MAHEFRLPDIGEGIAEGEITKILVKPGDFVKEDQAVLEVMTDKVTAEIPSPVSGTVTEIRVREGEVVQVGSVIMVFEKAAAGSKAPAQKQEVKETVTVGNGKSKASATSTAPTPAVRRDSSEPVLAAPATRKLARSMGVDITMIAGSGPRGRVTPDDVKNFSGDTGNTLTSPSTRSSVATTSAIATQKSEKRVPFAGMRRMIGDHLVKSKHTAPHFLYVEEVDMTELVSVRDQLRPVADEEGVKLNYLPFIIRAVISGLKAYPVVNSQLDEAAQEIVYKYDYNIGVAVATDNGLIVPVVKHADQKSLLELSREIKQLAEKARNGKLSLEDVKGGTFTITSIGSIGGLFSAPIVNLPEVAILGVNKIDKRPVVRDNQIVIRDMMNLSISADHRVVDGAECALFIKHVVEQLQAPARLLIDQPL